MNRENKSRKISKDECNQRVSSLDRSSNKAITRLSEKLHQYEKKYNLRAEIFYKIIVGTPSEDTPDFISWAMCYRAYFRTLKSKFSIEEAGNIVV